MLRILHLIAQGLEYLPNRKSLLIKQRQGFNDDVHDNAYYKDNEDNTDFTSLDNIIPSEEDINWPFTSIINSPHTYIDLDESSKFDDYIDIAKQKEVTIDTLFIFQSKEGTC